MLIAVLQAPAPQAPGAVSSSDRAWELYYQVRSQVETPENIGKLILFDLVSGDHEIAEDQRDFDAGALIRKRHPDADIFCMRIGYLTSASFCGFMERISA